MGQEGAIGSPPTIAQNGLYVQVFRRAGSSGFSRLFRPGRACSQVNCQGTIRGPFRDPENVPMYTIFRFSCQSLSENPSWANMRENPERSEGSLSWTFANKSTIFPEDGEDAVHRRISRFIREFRGADGSDSTQASTGSSPLLHPLDRMGIREGTRSRPSPPLTFALVATFEVRFRRMNPQ